jgi:hypothetical protein
MTVTIRKAVDADLDAILRLNAQVDGAIVGYAWFEIQDRPQTSFT